ncbi:MAG: hypothetical protein QM479_08900, partial [Pseudomonadota bacterium]
HLQQKQQQQKQQHNNSSDNIVVASDARMNEVYLACYQQRDGFVRLVGEEKLVAPELIGQNIQSFCSQNPQWIALGSGWNEYQQSLVGQLDDFPYTELIVDCLPHAQDIAFLAMDKLAKNQFGDAQTALPVYLRNNVAKKSSQQKKLSQQ